MKRKICECENDIDDDIGDYDEDMINHSKRYIFISLTF